ncbi:MAG: 4Fe-4S dicluster domain-containing protein [Candidatus Jordarchaeales archaeon]
MESGIVSAGRIVIAVDYFRCSGCRRCEVVCSIHHEGRIWPEASRIRVFAPSPGVEVPHVCVQCDEHPCVDTCPAKALNVDEKTGAIIVSEECTGCGGCIEACPGSIPHLHPVTRRAIICDLCGGEPLCVKACSEGGWNALKIIQREEKDKYSVKPREPMEIAKELAAKLFGEEEGRRLLNANA